MVYRLEGKKTVFISKWEDYQCRKSERIDKTTITTTQKLILELTSKYEKRKTLRYKDNIQRSISFLHISNWHLKWQKQYHLQKYPNKWNTLG